jgi:penicillin-binding protein 1A
LPWWARALAHVGLLIAGGAVAGALLMLFTFAIVYSNLPPIDALTDYRPKIPLRVWTSDGALIGEFGEERRDFLPFAEIPEPLKKAILAAEDDGFYQHRGVDYSGLVRAAISNFVSGRRGQGGSTITMQVARNFFLSSERSYVRKVYEIALAYKIESSLSKDRIFEVYANQIFLGQRAYGFAAAAQVYFGKKPKDLTVAEMATLAGLPVAPSAYNPFVNPRRAKARQQYVLARMLQLGYIDKATHDEAVAQELRPRQSAVEVVDNTRTRLHAEYAAELARQLVFEVFHAETYTRGLNVVTTLRKDDQEVAYAALRKQVLEYDRKYGYRGPEAFIELTDDASMREQRIEDALVEAIESPNLLPAVVLEVTPGLVRVAVQGAILQGAAEPQDRAGRGGTDFAGRQDRLGDHAAAAGRGGVRRREFARRCREGPGRRLRLQSEQVQSRYAGLAAARIELQTVHLLCVARERIHAEHADQRCADFDRSRTDGRAGLGAEEL